MSLLLSQLTPATVPTYVAPVAPERFARPAPQQPASLVFTPQTIVAAVPFFGAVYPDRLDRPRAPLQPDAFASPIRDRTAPLATVVGPERLDRPKPLQPESFVAAIRERTATFFDAMGPPRLDRPQPQQPPSPPPIPERTGPLVTVVAPDRLDPRPRPQQPESLVAPIRDRTSPAAAAFAPERLDPPRRPTLGEIALVEADRTAPLASAVYPDRLERPRAQQPENAPPIRVDVVQTALDWLPEWPQPGPRRPPQQPAQPLTPTDRTSPLASSVGPERLDRPKPQQPDAFVATPRDRTSTFFDAVAPERLDRPRPQQPDAFVAPIRDRTSPLASAIVPDRLDRARAQQPEQGPPIRERTAVFFDAVGPERLDRPKPQQPESFIAPIRERTAPLASAAGPDRLDRPRAPQPENAPPIRERTAVFFDAVAPERLDRPKPQQPDAFVAPIRDRTSPLAETVAPDSLDRPRAQQPESHVAAPRDRSAPAADAFYPDRLDRPTYPVDEQVAVFLVEPEETIELPCVVAPERFDRPHARQPEPQPPIVERTSVFFDAGAPDRLDRPKPQQPDAFAATPRDRRAPFFDVVAPDYFPRTPPQQPPSLSWVRRIAPRPPPTPGPGPSGGSGAGPSRRCWPKDWKQPPLFGDVMPKPKKAPRHPRVEAAQKVLERWMSQEDMTKVPSSTWDLFAEDKVNLPAVYKMAELWHGHVAEIRAAFPDSQGPEEERIWALVNERWIAVWSAFVEKLAAGAIHADVLEGLTPASLGAIVRGEPAEDPEQIRRRTVAGTLGSVAGITAFVGAIVALWWLTRD